MAIQYPDFRADPNAVPNLSQIPTIFEGIQKGITIGNLPRQLRMQREQAAANLEATQQRNRFYPLVQQQALDKGAIDLQNLSDKYKAEIAAQNASANASNANAGLTNQQASWLPRMNSAQLQNSIAQRNAENAQTDYTNTQNRLAPGESTAKTGLMNAQAQEALAQAQASKTQENPYQKALLTAQGTNMAKAISDTDAQLSEANQQQATLQNIAKKIISPSFPKAVGTANQYLASLGWSGKDAKELNGNLKNLSAKLQEQTAAGMSGKAARANIILAGMQKPQVSDQADIFRGKLEALDAGNRWRIDYLNQLQKYRNLGYSGTDAINKANDDVPSDKYEGKMKRFLSDGTIASKYKSQNKDFPIVYQADQDGDEYPYVVVHDANGASHLVSMSDYDSARGKG